MIQSNNDFSSVIKFRVFKHNKMYGPEEIDYISFSGDEIKFKDQNSETVTVLSKVVLEQFWKKDKNDKDIYVGDKVVFDYYSKPLVVERDENGFHVKFDNQTQMPMSKFLEVVGNIHENMEE